MSGYVNPVFRPDFTDYPAPSQNRLASGFNAIWPASNPVGTETTQGMQSATPTDQIAFMRPDGTPVMQSDLARAHEQVQTAMQVAPTMALGMVGDAPGIRAFHGSPYDFERFDTSKIGTGEGNQAFGRGLYFADKPGTAETYKFANQPSYMNTATANVAQDAYQEAVKSGVADPMAAARNSLWERRQASTDPIERRRIDDAYNNIEQLTQPGGVGKMYEVNIGADPEHFLHWDKPLSEQSPQVQQALGKLGIQPHDYAVRQTDNGYVVDYQGKTSSRAFPTQEAAQSAADATATMQGKNPLGSEIVNHNPGIELKMADAGIPGIRYLDQGSRNAGGWHITPPDQTVSGKWMVKSNDYNSKGMHFDNQADARAALDQKIGGQTHNYVVFDANTIDILRKYGLAGLGIGLGATAAGTQQQSQ